MNNAIFAKTMENVWKHKDINLVITKSRRNYLVSEPNYHNKYIFTEYILAIKMKKKNKERKTEVLMNKPVCFELSILELSNSWVFVWLCKTQIW